MNNVNSITIVSEIKIDIWMPVAILLLVPLLRERRKGKITLLTYYGRISH